MVVLRTRDQEVLKQCAVVVDVGGEFNPETLRFDHHMPCEETFDEERQTRLSAAGMVYRHFGQQIFSVVFGAEKRLAELLYPRLYENFVEAVDALDNGIAIADSTKYKIRTDFTTRMSSFNTPWNDFKADENLFFANAVAAAKKEFSTIVQGLIDVWWPARALAEKGFNDRMNFHPSGKMIFIEEASPWIEHLYEIEKGANAEGEILFAVYPDWAAPGDYRIQCVPVKNGDFKKRLPLPSELGGLGEEELKKSGIDDLRFVHKALFIGGAHSLKGAISLGELAMRSAG
eukprot:Polyplicarium_translucidae@DN3331_c1_g1_i1.p2